MSVDPVHKPRNETEHERLDRQLIEMLQGFRVAVTGVQVLFAFLLTVPFAARFDKVDDTGEILFYIALFGAAAASICFSTPVFQHRILFRLNKKAVLIRRANRLGICGGVALAVSISAATTLIVQTLTADWWAIVTAAVVVAVCAWLWFVQPFRDRIKVTRTNGDGDGDDDG
ncbi:DUF6328 family protein [Actinomadura algeriensis]|uniref:Protein-S-isoprenylcysteine O-methyltransferase Ste14 n=1 Tax=Actinomadura algeriensis TaxID=1679523 RepID=A0ABR9JTF8_9ACTN|nr:DUF6328 family protein [Actinomadura algeriensis]MBE1533843.1 protein-S-isoprenylcysteine O-methyltransferase Ste14 [Actinomadura algeriensis]